MKCKIIDVPKDCCYLSFSKKRSIYASSADYYTIRGEQIILRLDGKKNNSVIGIELLYSKKAPKPCQRCER